MQASLIHLLQVAPAVWQLPLAAFWTVAVARTMAPSVYSVGADPSATKTGRFPAIYW